MMQEAGPFRLFDYKVTQYGIRWQLFAWLTVLFLIFAFLGFLFVVVYDPHTAPNGPLSFFTTRQQYVLWSFIFCTIQLIFACLMPLILARSCIRYNFTSNGLTESCGYVSGLVPMRRQRKWVDVRFWNVHFRRSNFEIYFKGSPTITIAQKDSNDIRVNGTAVDWKSFADELDSFLKTRFERGYPKSVLLINRIRLWGLLGFIVLAVLALIIAYVSPFAIFFMNIVNHFR